MPLTLRLLTRPLFPGITFTNGYLLQGTLPYVSSDLTFDVAVTRTNAYGSSTGTLQITVTDNPAASAIAGWTVHQGNTVSNNILHSENSVLEYNQLLSPGQRVRIPFSGISKFGIPNASELQTGKLLTSSTSCWTTTTLTCCSLSGNRVLSTPLTASQLLALVLVG